MESLGILEEITGRRRDRIFSYSPYVRLFRDEPPGREAEEIQETEAPDR
jgi:hypothetical protein